MAIPSGTKLGSYEVTLQVGAGGMGEVYQAHDTKLGRDVAIKVLPEAFANDPERLSRFQREAKMLAALNHPNIATIFGLEQSRGTSYLVMELVPGETLQERVKRDGPVSVEETLAIAKQIAEALEAAHEKGIIHRDLKPANVKVTPEGKVKVLDFGLAKAFEGDPSSVDISNSPTLSQAATMQGVILGTAAYMSPEQARGRAVNKATDIWAFGCVLYEMLCGHKPFDGEDVTEILASVVKTEPDWSGLPEATPQAIRVLLRRCLRKDRRQRLQDATGIRIEIEDVLSGAIPSAAPVQAVAEPKPQLPFGWMALAAVLFVALASLAFVHFRESPATLQTIRFQLSGPENSNVNFFQLSPDGQYLAFIEQKEGQAELWVRPLGSLEAQPLRGTDEATYPFWSPDSASIGFFAQGKLKKIAVTGGEPQILCDAPAGRGGAWGADGVIIFSANIGGPLYRVSAAGGVPSQVTKMTGSISGDTDRYPEFLPDGHTFLYTRLSGKAETEGIYASSLEGTQPVHLLPDESSSKFASAGPSSRAGYLLFRRKSTLMAQPFDTSRLRTNGEMFPIAEKVGTNTNTGNVAFSASANGELAFRSGSVFDARQFVWMDRSGNQLGIVTKPATFISGALSPDEKQMVMSILPDATTGDLWLQDITRAVISRFTFEPGRSSEPIWSPDSSRIVYTRIIGPNFGIYQKPVNGAGAAELLKGGGINLVATDWSPDGKFIVYSEYSDSTNDDLWLLPLEGDRKPILFLQTPFNESDGHFSPDGRWMTYMSNESGRDEVYVQTFPSTGSKWQVSTAGGRFPRWSKDGHELFYVAADQKLMTVAVKPGAAGSHSFEAGSPQPLFEIKSIPIQSPVVFPYQPSADGRRFLVDIPATGEGAAPTPITVVVNWQAGLKK
jgi:eukaryotic-like serine/threonine-protein kinase